MRLGGGDTMKALRIGAWIALAALAAARLVRFITSDFLGEWTIVGPWKRYAARREVPDHLREALETRIEDEIERGAAVANPPAAWGWRSKVAKGLECGYCLSPWIFGGLLIGTAIFSRIPGVRWAWAWLLGTLGGSYIIGHTWNRLDNAS